MPVRMLMEQWHIYVQQGTQSMSKARAAPLKQQFLPRVDGGGTWHKSSPSQLVQTCMFVSGLKARLFFAGSPVIRNLL